MKMLRTFLALLLAPAICYLCLADEHNASIATEIKDSCALSNGMGLNNLIKQAATLLPKDELINVMEKYRQDPEVRALKQYLTSEKYQNTMKLLKESKEYQALEEFICENLHIDLNYYRRLLKLYIRRLNLNKAAIEEYKGIDGLINDIIKILPHEELYELYMNLMATDAELRKAAYILKSPDLYNLVRELKNTEIFEELRQQFAHIGVPLDKWSILLSNALEWPEAFTNLF